MDMKKRQVIPKLSPPSETSSIELDSDTLSCYGPKNCHCFEKWTKCLIPLPLVSAPVTTTGYGSRGSPREAARYQTSSQPDPSTCCSPESYGYHHRHSSSLEHVESTNPALEVIFEKQANAMSPSQKTKPPIAVRFNRQSSVPETCGSSTAPIRVTFTRQATVPVPSGQGSAPIAVRFNRQPSIPHPHICATSAGGALTRQLSLPVTVGYKRQLCMPGVSVGYSGQGTPTVCTGVSRRVSAPVTSPHNRQGTG